MVQLLQKDMPCRLWCEPLGHLEHTVAPGDEVNSPNGQSEHVGWLLVLVNLPAGQREHAVAAGPEKLPAAQGAQTVTPWRSENLPLSHGRHEAWRSVDE